MSQEKSGNPAQAAGQYEDAIPFLDWTRRFSQLSYFPSFLQICEKWVQLNFFTNICKPNLAYFTSILKKWLKTIAKKLVLPNYID
jgi:hypothetical protein